MTADYTQNKGLYYLKVLLQWALVITILYQSHLAMRDSDGSTFEMRVRESIKFIQKNHPGYRLYIFHEFGIDKKNCTADVVDNMIDMAPVYVISSGQFGVMAAVMVLLNSRLGNICTLLHSLFVALGLNMD